MHPFTLHVGGFRPQKGGPQGLQGAVDGVVGVLQGRGDGFAVFLLLGFEFTFLVHRVFFDQDQLRAFDGPARGVDQFHPLFVLLHHL